MSFRQISSRKPILMFRLQCVTFSWITYIKTLNIYDSLLFIQTKWNKYGYFNRTHAVKVDFFSFNNFANCLLFAKRAFLVHYSNVLRTFEYFIAKMVFVINFTPRKWPKKCKDHNVNEHDFVLKYILIYI